MTLYFSSLNVITKTSWFCLRKQVLAVVFPQWKQRFEHAPFVSADTMGNSVRLRAGWKSESENQAKIPFPPAKRVSLNHV